jgi:transposase
MAEQLIPDEVWAAIAPLLPPKRPIPRAARPWDGDRAVLGGIIYVLRAGVPWQLLPARELGCGSGVTCWRLRRWLAEDAIKPWRYRSWIFPRDPAFADKAGRVLDLYQRRWHDVELGADEYVISADEKSQLQVLRRIHPDQPAQPARGHRVEFEYECGGTVAYLAAYNVHRAQLMGRVEPTTRIIPFAALVEQVMTTEPYASARRVFWVLDNGSSHAGTASIQRMAAAWPTATLVHLPVHASWLNQIEIVFSILQRKVIAPAGFTDREAHTRRITEFEPRFNATATPFDWRFTRCEAEPGPKLEVAWKRSTTTPACTPSTPPAGRCRPMHYKPGWRRSLATCRRHGHWSGSTWARVPAA